VSSWFQARRGFAKAPVRSRILPGIEADYDLREMDRVRDPSLTIYYYRYLLLGG
jgi:hypothetical protein